MDDDPFKKVDKFGIQMLVAFALSIGVIVLSNTAFGQSGPTWVQKPVQCGELAEVIQIQEAEGLEPLLVAKGHARMDETPKLVDDVGYVFYYNSDKQYWSMIEIFREDYACVIAMGTALQFN